MGNSKNCIDACLACAIECESCATHCIGMNDKEHQKRIALCRDCADISALCARFEARGSAFTKALFKLCAEICNACVAECEKLSADACCKSCAAACKKCADACAAM